MRRLLVLGGGTAGTMVVSRLRRRLDRSQWQITVVDQDDIHLYQPGQLLLPFGTYRAGQLVKSRRRLMPAGVDLVLGEIDKVDPDACQVALIDGRTLGYDYLVIATGASPRPDQTPGMLGPLWRKSVFDFYTLDGSIALRRALREFTGGRLVVHIVDMPIKCPVAPLEFTFLAEAEFRRRGMRELRAGGQAHPAVPGARQHLRDRRCQRHPDIQGRVCGALRGRVLGRQLLPARGRPADDRQLRRARELLHRDRRRQGRADRLQLRH